MSAKKEPEHVEEGTTAKNAEMANTIAQLRELLDASNKQRDEALSSKEVCSTNNQITYLGRVQKIKRDSLEVS